MKTYINEIKENDHVDSFFLVKEKSSGVTKTGNVYLKLKLIDRSGEMEGRVWTPVELFIESFEKDDFVHVKGKAVSFQEHLQLNITHIERVEENTIQLSDFFPVAERDIDEMLQCLIEISQKVKNQHLSQLLHRFHPSVYSRVARSASCGRFTPSPNASSICRMCQTIVLNRSAVADTSQSTPW